MAKSLRSKPKLRAKSIKRKAEFSKFVDDRNARLAEKAAAHLSEQKELSVKSETALKVEEPEAVPEKKISTSGWRSSNSQKRAKKRKVAKKKTMQF